MSPDVETLRLVARSCPSCGAVDSLGFCGAKLDARRFGELTFSSALAALSFPAGNLVAVAFKE